MLIKQEVGSVFTHQGGRPGFCASEIAQQCSVGHGSDALTGIWPVNSEGPFLQLALETSIKWGAANGRMEEAGFTGS